MITRKGKIARLPRAVREELNNRLLDGESGNDLVHWLNEKKEVQTVLREDFGGRAITEQNLSEWRQGGYEDWLRHQDALEMNDRILEESEDYLSCDEVTQADRLAGIGAAALGRLLHASLLMPDGPEKHRAIIDGVRELARMRRAERDREREWREQREEDRKQRGSETSQLLDSVKAFQKLAAKQVAAENARLDEKEAQLKAEKARMDALEREARKAEAEETEDQEANTAYLPMGKKSNQIQPDPTKSDQRAAGGT